MTLFNAADSVSALAQHLFAQSGGISVVPRPYQYVPLIMTLRQNPVRLVVADDVGVGKTIEAAHGARVAGSRIEPGAARSK